MAQSSLCNVTPRDLPSPRLAPRAAHTRATTPAPPPRQKPNVLRFFTGAGGLDLGLRRAGFNIALACEKDKWARATLRANHPTLPILEDITKVSAEDVLHRAGLRAEDVTLIAGGPPCQSFSTAGAGRGMEDPRGQALLRFVEIIHEIRPKYFLIENVAGLASNRHKRAFEYILCNLKYRRYYAISFGVYNAADYGAPQIRKRLIVIGTLCERPVRLFYVPQQSFFTRTPRWRTFLQAVNEPTPLIEADADAAPVPARRVQFYEKIGPGGNWRDLPEEIQKEAMGGAYSSGGGRTGYFRRIAWDLPCPTLVTSPTQKITSLVHPEQIRALSVQEYKRIQQFPDKYVLCGSRPARYRQLGNAVPVGLAEAAGREILRHNRGHYK